MNMKPKVAVFASLGPPPYVGGVQNVVDTLLRSSLGDSFEFSVFDTYRVPNPERSLLAKFAYVPKLMSSCWTHLRDKRPALIHIHFCSRADFWKHSICLFIAHVLGIRVIFHLHGGSFDSFYAGLNPMLQWLARVIFRAPQCVVALSRFWEEYLATLVRRERIRIVNNPIDCERLAPAGSRNPDVDPPTILLLGSLGKRKGHYDVLGALPLVLEYHPSVKVLFAGSDEDPGATEDLQLLAADLEVKNHISFLGPVAFEPKTRLLQTATIMVLPSYGENMPISVLEAMAARMPVIATRVGALPEVLDEGKAGILIEPGEQKALAKAIVQLLDDPQAASQMGKVAGARAQSLWDVKSIAQRVVDLYQEVLSR